MHTIGGIFKKQTCPSHKFFLIIIFLIIIFITLKRTLRNHWRSHPEHKHKTMKERIVDNKGKIISGLLGLVAFGIGFYYYHVENTPLTNRPRFIMFNKSQFMKIVDEEYNMVKQTKRQKTLLPFLTINIFCLSLFWHTCTCGTFSERCKAHFVMNSVEFTTSPHWSDAQLCSVWSDKDCLDCTVSCQIRAVLAISELVNVQMTSCTTDFQTWTCSLVRHLSVTTLSIL